MVEGGGRGWGTVLASGLKRDYYIHITAFVARTAGIHAQHWIKQEDIIIKQEQQSPFLSRILQNGIKYKHCGERARKDMLFWTLSILVDFIIEMSCRVMRNFLPNYLKSCS